MPTVAVSPVVTASFPATFKIKLETGEETVLESGSAFPLNAHPETQVIFDATHVANEYCHVLSETSWKYVKDFINFLKTGSKLEIARTLQRTRLALAGTTFDDAETDPQRFENYLVDLQLIVMIVAAAQREPLCRSTRFSDDYVIKCLNYNLKIENGDYRLFIPETGNSE